ncbi:MAG: hypothetical protein IK066_07875 [Kiritimatiellae bacterium]|nr:hypothetical protein [Kiritimatiellia bacterium]
MKAAVPLAFFLAAILGAPVARSVTDEEFLAILEAEMNVPIEGNHPFLQTDFDDSAWQTVSLPLSPDAPPLWPEGADGAIWYRRSFLPAQDLSQPCRYDDVDIHWDPMTNYVYVYLNGARATPGLRPDGTLNYSAWPPELQPGTNTLAVSAPIRGGQGWSPTGAPDNMNIWMCFGIYYDGPDDSGYVITDEWTIPLAGEWKYLFVPTADISPEGDAP